LTKLRIDTLVIAFNIDDTFVSTRRTGWIHLELSGAQPPVPSADSTTEKASRVKFPRRGHTADDRVLSLQIVLIRSAVLADPVR
jgi:hypothetical protein